jgi:hypothetical protein
MTHSFVYEIKEASWWLERHDYVIHIMWITSHVGVRGNERVDRLAIRSLLLLSDFLNVGRYRVAGARVGWVDILIRFCLRSH